jgi:rhodanese-related sulfurtransferase
MALVAASCTTTSPESAANPTAPPAASPLVARDPVRHLAPAAFADAIRQTGVILIDVRTPAEYATGYIASARNIDVNAADFAQRIAALDKAGRYALYCRTGHRSATAAAQMAAAGFTNVVDLAGGITAWVADGRPIAN